MTKYKQQQNSATKTIKLLKQRREEIVADTKSWAAHCHWTHICD